MRPFFGREIVIQRIYLEVVVGNSVFFGCYASMCCLLIDLFGSCFVSRKTSLNYFVAPWFVPFHLCSSIYIKLQEPTSIQFRRFTLAGHMAVECAGTPDGTDSEEENEEEDGERHRKSPRIEPFAASDSLTAETEKPASVTPRIDSIRFITGVGGDKIDLADICIRDPSLRHGYPANAFYIECALNDGGEETYRVRCAAGCKPIGLVLGDRCDPFKNFATHRRPKHNRTQHEKCIEQVLERAQLERKPVELLYRSNLSSLPEVLVISLKEAHF
jgi:hypothetical protein